MSKITILTGVILTLFITMACSLGTQKADFEPAQAIGNTVIMEGTKSIEQAQPLETNAVTEAASLVEQAQPSSQENAAGEESPFPLTNDAMNITVSAESVNFQTGMSLSDSIAYYRQVFTGQGLTENGLLTVITEDTFSMVFEGSPNGRALVIQGVDLGTIGTNIHIRYEDL